nr:Mov34/MPN/PAD-1 family protein [Myxococcus xanthus]
MRDAMTLDTLVFQRPCGGRVKVGPEAHSQFLRFRQMAPHQEEAGGVMLGRHLLDCNDTVIDEVTSPLPGDRRGRFSFHRASQRHQAVMDARWTASGGTCLYLGEWHTHPEPWPSPSGVDINDWRRRLNEDSFEGDSLLFLIIGMDGMNAWEGLRHARRIVPLPRWQPLAPTAP